MLMKDLNLRSESDEADEIEGAKEEEKKTPRSSLLIHEDEN